MSSSRVSPSLFDCHSVFWGDYLLTELNLVYFLLDSIDFIGEQIVEGFFIGAGKIELESSELQQFKLLKIPAPFGKFLENLILSSFNLSTSLDWIVYFF
jgi:hypothetical protein